jgi:putative transposase
MRYHFITAHRERFHVTTMCRVLQVSRAGYYASQQRPPSAHAEQDVALTVAIAAAHRRSRGRYGSPRLRAELAAAGRPVSRKRVARLMRTAGLAGKRPRRARPRTTDAAHPHPVAPNTVARQFAAATTVDGLDQVWTADITYLPTREGWLYLAVVLDLGSRRVVGWAMQATLERTLPLAALALALAQRQPAAGLVHHSDRGSQYACGHYQAELATHGVACSMSRAGDCWDNAVTESFFATLETELITDADWATREAARPAIFEFIEVWYNRQRRHSTLGYLSPAEYEQRLQQQATPMQEIVVPAA